ncbi:MAG: CYTH and CHAD domain-containing protein [Rhodocyclaceae bacterium]|nr:CYTH and CHAD domain-containing protein [Rhodocyclaceae bacterium]
MEVELKLALPASARRAFLRQPVLAAALAKHPARRVFSIYFDTPDLDLRARGIALRLRRLGRQWLQTVKCAGVVEGGLASRPEWEQPYDGRAFDFSQVDQADVRKFLEKARRKGLLSPVFETDFRRRTWHFEPLAGSRLELAFDEGVIRSGERSLPLCELEIEIQEGDTGPLLHLAQDLAASLPLRPDARSKAERGYRLFSALPPAPVHALPARLAPDEGTRGSFRKIALACLSQMQGNEEGVLASEDPEFIHQMRVGLRRLRSALRTFGPALAPEFVAGFDAPLRALARKLGAARDRDVLVDDVIRPVMAAFPGDARLEWLAALAGKDRLAAREGARAAVADPGYGRLILDLVAALHRPDFDQALDSLAAFAGLSLKDARRRVGRRAARAIGLDPLALHSARIAVKHLRYSLEFLSVLYRRDRVRVELSRLTALQSDLGHINDLANARRLLLALADTPSPHLCEALALLEGWHRGRMEHLLAGLPRRLAALAGKRAPQSQP